MDSNIEPDSCQACYEDFPEAGKVIPCACGTKICKNCTIKYLLTQDRKAHCMSCEGNYTMSFCIENFGRSFMTKKYRDHMKNVLFGLEKSRFPETMPEVVLVKNKKYFDVKMKEYRIEKKLVNSEIRAIQDKHRLNWDEQKLWNKNTYNNGSGKIVKTNFITNPLFGKPTKLLSDEEFEILKKKIKDLSSLVSSLTKPLRKKRNIVNKKIRELKKSVYNPNRATTSTKTKVINLFTQKCSVADCEGFLSDKWFCELCKNKTCSKCLETKDAEHVCNPDNVKTAKLIKSTTRNCPGCATAIHRIHGCDQMWCTKCNVPFSYKTGKKINGPVHNPHFFQWLQDNPGANPQQNQQQNRGNVCRDPLNYRDIQMIKVSGDIRKKIYEFHRLSLHFRDTVLNKALNNEPDNLDLRIKFIMKDQNETRVKRTLHTRQNKRNKEIEFIHLYEFMATIMVESFFSIQKNNSNDHTLKMFEEVEKARVYCNKELKKISKAYGHKTQVISEEYNVKYLSEYLEGIKIRIKLFGDCEIYQRLTKKNCSIMNHKFD